MTQDDSDSQVSLPKGCNDSVRSHAMLAHVQDTGMNGMNDESTSPSHISHPLDGATKQLLQILRLSSSGCDLGASSWALSASSSSCCSSPLLLWFAE